MPAPPVFLLPAALASAPAPARLAFVEFFAASLANANTRAAYLRDVQRFCAWCERAGCDLMSATPLDLAAYREELRRTVSPASVKRHFSALRRLYAWWVERGIRDVNPVREVKTERITRTEGKTPALDTDDMHRLFESFNLKSLVGLRDRAIIGVMAYTVARVEAVVSLRVRDYATHGRRALIQFREKGGKERGIPVHHRLAEYLDQYVEAAALAGEKDSPLFRAAIYRTRKLSTAPLSRVAAWRMIQRRLRDADIQGAFGCHSFRATGITTLLENGASLEVAQWLAGHADSRTTKLYDRRDQRAALEDLERIRY